MAYFKSKLGTSDGEIVFRSVHGQSAAEVRRYFQDEGYHVFSVSRSLEIGGFFDLRKKVPLKRFLLFNREFRGLVKAGLPVVEGFDILLRRMKPSRLRSILEQVRDALTKGQALSDAFAGHGEALPRYYPALLKAGEQSGNLVEVLDRFITQEERLRKTKKNFSKALTYPTLLMILATVALYVILTRALPQFTAMYQGAGRELPTITQWVVALSNWVGQYWLWALVLLGIGAIVLRLATTTRGGLRQLEQVLLLVPILGKLWLLHNQNIFVRTLRMLIAGGIPIPESIQITANAMPSPKFQYQLNLVHQAVLKGTTLFEALEEHTRFQETVGEMIRIGESTGTLADMLEHLGDYGEEQAQDLMEMIASIVAPLMLLVIGIVIAFIVLAMYLPMFGASSLIG